MAKKTETTKYRGKGIAKNPAQHVTDVMLQSQFGKLPPQAVDLEEAVLGALMLEKNALTSVIDILPPDCFYKDAHRIIYGAICRLFEKSQPIDLLTVSAELRSS